MLTLGQMINSASQRWRNPGLSQRASEVRVLNVKAGFRPNWKVPETEYWNSPGVQEVLFVTQAAGPGAGGTTRLSDGSSYTKPYKTTFRFPLDPATGQPYGPGVGAQALPVWVHCSCPAFRFYCEVKSKDDGNSDIIDSNGGQYRVNQPTHLCKHLFATAKAAMQKRVTIGTTASIHTKQKDHAEPKLRDPEKVDTVATAAKRRTPKTAATERTKTSIPSTWLGRLMYVLFNERTR